MKRTKRRKKDEDIRNRPKFEEYRLWNNRQ